MRPRVVGRVKALISEGAGVHFANKGQVAVQVGVPRDRTNGKERRRSQCHARVHEGLRNALHPCILPFQMFRTYLKCRGGI